MALTKRSTATGDQRIDALLSGSAWGGPVTYSFPDAASDYEAGYDVHDQAIGAFYPTNAGQRLALHSILDADRLDARQRPAFASSSVEGFTDLEISYAESGILRAANSAAVGTAYAYLPHSSPYGGDMWFGGMGGDARVGTIDFTTVLHEAGHALGLKHSHETSDFGPLPTAWDSPEFSVMTYRPYQGSTSFGSRYRDGDAPQTFMILDIAALQALYGADFTSNGGDTTYSWDVATGRSFVNGALAIAPTGRTIFQTIWDGGGRDSYDLGNHTADLRIDLGPGASSAFGVESLSYLGGGPNGGFARGSVFNALQHRGDPRSLIEDAVGGSGDDRLAGNAGANRLVGNDGHDRLDGRGGADVMVGGGGNDLYVVDNAGDRTLETARGAASGTDTVVSAVSVSMGANVETLVLSGRAVSGGGNGHGNSLGGNALDNNLNGRSGHDRIAGRGGSDTLFGGEGHDQFRFFSVLESTPAAFDRLKPAGGAPAFEGAGAARGDRIDLRGIDADPSLAGDQAFRFGPAQGPGSLWAKEYRGNTYIRAEVDAAAGYDFQIRIEDGEVRAAAYTADDFLL